MKDYQSSRMPSWLRSLLFSVGLVCLALFWASIVLTRFMGDDDTPATRVVMTTLVLSFWGYLLPFFFVIRPAIRERLSHRLGVTIQVVHHSKGSSWEVPERSQRKTKVVVFVAEFGTIVVGLALPFLGLVFFLF